MSVRRRQNWVSQQRVDSPHIRSVESAVSNDFDELLSGLVTDLSKGYVVRGFEISMAGAIGGSASGLQLIVDSGAILHGTSNESGTFYVVPSGTSPEVLNSTINTKVRGSFTPNAVNYVGIEYERVVDDATADQVQIWNPTNKNETPKTIPLAKILRYTIVITTSLWATNVLPITKITTDVANNVVDVTDDRANLFRLGTGGRTNPNPAYSYPWTKQSEGRLENPPTSTSNSTNPFRGGDKMLGSLKEWMDAMMTSFKEIKGTTFWYSANSGGSLISLRADLANTVFTGRGNISHDEVTAGRINWSDDIYIKFIGGRLAYKILANPTPNTYISLADEEVAYIKLVRGVTINPNLIWTNGSAVVSSVGAVSWTSQLVAGDWVKLATDDDTKYYQILTVDSLSQITLVSAFTGTSTGPSGAKSHYAFGVYEAVAVPSSDRHVKIDAREDVPFDQDHFWFLLRSDNGGATPKVYARFIAAELQQGETRQISDNTSDQIVQYIGAPSEADGTPNYSSNVRGVASESLTARLGTVTDAVSDEQEDRSGYLRSDDPVTWDGASLSFTADIVLEFVNTKSGVLGKHTIPLTSSPIALANLESAYVLIDRSQTNENLTVVLSGTTPIPAQQQSTKDVFVLFRRQDAAAGNFLHIPFHKQLIESGSAVRLGASGGAGGGGGGTPPQFFQETPSGVVNGINDTFILSNTPKSNGSVLTHLDTLGVLESEAPVTGTSLVFAGTSIPQLGQQPEVFYIVDTTNNLVGQHEVPTGLVDGINDTFVLAGSPPSAAAALVLVNGLKAKVTEWSLVGANSVVFNAGSIPQPGQSVEVYYVINIGTTVVYQEAPAGLVNGINDTFTLSSSAPYKNAALVFVNGRKVRLSEWNLISGGTQIMFNAGSIPQLGQSVEVYYFRVVGAVGSYNVNRFTLTPTDITNGYVILTGSPTAPDATILNIIGGVIQDYSTDFVVTGSQLSWSGLGLDGVLVSGDKLVVQFN